jgi:hypothetical protein
VNLSGAGGTTALSVLAVWDSGDYAGNSIYIHADTMRSLYGEQPVQFAVLDPAPGVSAATAAQAVRRVTTDARLRVLSPEEIAAESSDSVASFLRPFWFLVNAMVAVSLVTVGLTILLSTAQRGAEYRTLQSLGSPLRRTQIILIVQTAVMTAVVAAVALLLSVLSFISTRVVAGYLFGIEPPFRWSFGPWVMYSLLTCAVAVVATAAASYAGLRRIGGQASPVVA